MRDDLTWKIRVQPGQQGRRDHGPGHDLVWRDRILQGMWIVDSAGGLARQEVQLVLLVVRVALGIEAETVRVGLRHLALIERCMMADGLLDPG